ncbi:MAG: ABC transporter ATP-binding protein [Mycoplasmoidaceae bacterium]
MKKIEFKNVSLGYNDKTNIVKNVNLTIEAGEFVSIIGPNGSGKSTLLFSIFSMVKLNQGTVFYDGKNLKEYSKKELAKKISFVPQISTFADDITVWEFVLFGRHPYTSVFFSDKKEDEIKVTDALEKVGLLEFKDHNVAELSGGQKQRALIALALAQDTEVIVLDEPTNHLDIKAQLQIIHLLHELNHKLKKTIILVIHDINHGLKFADKVVIMKDGEVKLIGKTNDIVNEQSIEEIFGVIPKIVKSDDKKIIYDYWIKGLEELQKYHKE